MDMIYQVSENTIALCAIARASKNRSLIRILEELQLVRNVWCPLRGNSVQIGIVLYAISLPAISIDKLDLSLFKSAEICRLFSR